MSPFSTGVHARPRTLWQFRMNHLSTFSESVNRSGVFEIAMGAIGFSARVMPSAVASLVWQVVQEGVSTLPSVWVEFQSLEPRSAEKPAKAGSACLASLAKAARIASLAGLAIAEERVHKTHNTISDGHFTSHLRELALSSFTVRMKSQVDWVTSLNTSGCETKLGGNQHLDFGLFVGDGHIGRTSYKEWYPSAKVGERIRASGLAHRDTRTARRRHAELNQELENCVHSSVPDCQEWRLYRIAAAGLCDFRAIL